MKRIRASNKIIIFADKTTKIYCLPREEYYNTRTIQQPQCIRKLTTPSKTKSMPLGSKVCLNQNNTNKQEQNSFISLKDQKQNFQNNQTAMLINPTKN